MPPNNRDWMWAEALDMIARTERMHRQLFQPARTPLPAWEPPVDVLETAAEVVIIAALPGVADADIKAVIEGPSLVLSGERRNPPEILVSAIHRMELPQGRFERRVLLPAGHYDRIARRLDGGCLYITLRKL
jgi:HSP20 family protein